MVASAGARVVPVQVAGERCQYLPGVVVCKIKAHEKPPWTSGAIFLRISVHLYTFLSDKSCGKVLR